MFALPQDALTILQHLNNAGYAAYVVGGCVRDTLLGVKPKDWDICTSARPEEMQQVFAGFHVVETGLKHGTLTVVMHHTPYEVTTFRVDGAYTDHRHPDGVTFVNDVTQDLARRDFTVNAMAYHPTEGLVDAFGGQEDLARRVIRCVGRASERFEEDALRILRAMRFASVYDFDIDVQTDAAIHALYPTMAQVAVERIRIELGKLLCGKGAGRILRAYPDVITFLLPELKSCVGFDQHTPHHSFDVWEHTVRAVEQVRPTEALRLTMLLHDSGKPECFAVDEHGVGHAYGHQKVSRDKAEQALARLRVDNATRDDVLLLVERHDLPITAERTLLKRRLSQYGERILRDLIEVQRADGSAKGTEEASAINACAQSLLAALDALLAENPCVTLKSLAVRGSDLSAAGFPRGPQMGQCLNAMLDAVILEQIPNERGALLAFAQAWLARQG